MKSKSSICLVICLLAATVTIIMLITVVVAQQQKLQRVLSANSDQLSTMQLLNKKYTQLDNLCENKYQTGIAGDLQTAYTIKGQIEQLKDEIKQLESKYINGNNL